MMEKTLPEVCIIQYGFPFDSSKFCSAEGVPLVRIRDVVRGYSETYTTEIAGENYIVNDGDLLIGMDGEFNIAYWKGGRAYLNQRVCRLIPREDVDRDYIFYYMPQALKAIEDATPFVTVKHLSAKQLSKILIPLPDMSEQQRISAVLRSVDRVIAMRKKELDELNNLVKSRFIELFGEPLSNQKGWQTMSIVEAAPIKSQRGDLADEVWLLNLDAVEAQTGTVLFKHRVQSGEINASTVYFTAESVLYSKLRPYLNKVVMPDEDGVATSEMIPMCPLADRLNRAYLCYWLRSDAFVRHISEKVAGAKMPRVSMDYFRSLAIEMPPLELQEQFAAFVEQTDKSKLAVQKGLQELEILKKSLMQQYVG